MLKENEIIELLKKALEKYIRCLERNDFDFLEYKGEIKAYLKILNKENLQINYLDIDKARELLKKINS